MKNIFKDANFGDKFVTDSGEIVIFHYKDPDYPRFYLIEANGDDMVCDPAGNSVYSDEAFIVHKISENITEVETLIAADQFYEDYAEVGLECEPDSFSWGFKDGVNWALEKLGIPFTNDLPKEN